MINYTQDSASKCLAKFIWNFKVGDNILYNFKILFLLYESKHNFGSNQELLIKPIIIQIVSIIEGIFYDLICRLDGATNHFPQHIPSDKRDAIKAKLKSEKIWFKRLDGIRYQRIKNYSFDNLITFFQEYDLLGPSDSDIYIKLRDSAYIRNRIHIFNYFNNHSKNEDYVFSEWRLSNVEALLHIILPIMESLYKRPFN